MGRYIARRIAQLLPVVLGITLVVFFLIRLVPGDPAVIMLGNKATPENVARLRKNLGLDKPVIVQYGYFMKNLAKGDLGESIFYRQPVRGIIRERVAPPSF